MDSLLDSFFSKKVIFITGGTGSFGNVIARRLLETTAKKIIIFSRDEKKQYDMRMKLTDSRLVFMIGDVRDYDRLQEAVPSNIDIIYHAAALKQVPYCEDYPFEAVLTNIIGARNIRRIAIEKRAELCMAISTDKAVEPVNVMGMTKALQERIFNCNHDSLTPRFACVRYGNVLGSRGSVVPFFHSLIKAGKPVQITDPNMTRFWLTLGEAVSLVFVASLEAKGGEVFVRKMPACLVTQLASVMAKIITKKEGYPVEIVGIRPGEKIHEVLVSEEEMHRTVESLRYFKISSSGLSKAPPDLIEYRSDNTIRMAPEELETVLVKEGWV